MDFILIIWHWKYVAYLCYIFAFTEPVNGGNELDYRCDKLKNHVSKRVCTSYYPSTAKTLYGDHMAQVGLTYSVYVIGDREGDYFITHGRSPLNGCKKLKVKDDSNFVCDGEPVELTKDSRLNCITYKLRLADALVSHCAPKAMICSNYSVMHYVDAEASYLSAIDLDGLRNSQSLLCSKFYVIICIVMISCIF